MGQWVVTGALLQCSMGVAPSPLTVIPKGVNVGGPPAAVVTDSAPMVNIKPFGMCSSISNPTVASATAAALGVLTPMPCIPSTPAPWSPGSATVKAGGLPVLNNNSKTQCTFGGVVSIVSPGQFTTQVP